MLASSVPQREVKRCMSLCRCRETTHIWHGHQLKAGEDGAQRNDKEKQEPPPPTKKKQNPQTPTQRTLALHRRTDTAPLKQLFGSVLFFLAAHPSARMA